MEHLVGLLAAAGTFALLGAWWLWTEVPREDYVLLSEDERLAHLSQHCSAEVILPEDEEVPNGWTMHSAVVLLLHGEVSPLYGWPKDPRAPTWDCRPADLPRHWRINNQVHFQAVAEDGQLLERSFEPELDTSANDLDEPWASRSCAADQLTSDGFKQAVLNGRRLAGRYGEVLASAALEAYSTLDCGGPALSTDFAAIRLNKTRKSGKCNMSFYRSGSETNHGAVGRATLLKPGSLASLVPFKGFAEERELRERMLLKCFLARHGFPSLHRPREFGPSAVLRIEHLYPIHVAARKGDADMVRIMLKNGADADVTHGGSNALDMAQEEDEDGSHLEVLQVLADLLELKCQTF
eukprot:symbB.v1.2.010671.t1/scaffold700.1/size171416/12